MPRETISRIHRKGKQTITTNQKQPSSTITQTSPSNATEVKLPLFTLEERKRLFDLKNHVTRLSYLYSPERAERHRDAKLGQALLYHLGASLINEGWAYLVQPEQLSIDSSGKINLDTDAQTLISAENHPSTAISFRDIYDRLPEYKDPYQAVSNPFHAMFVMKVALDHLPADYIWEWARHLGAQSVMMTHGTGARFILPNKSYFAEDHATVTLLNLYIAFNQERFSNYIRAGKVKQSWDELASGNIQHISYSLFGSQFKLRQFWDILTEAFKWKPSVCITTASTPTELTAGPNLNDSKLNPLPIMEGSEEKLEISPGISVSSHDLSVSNSPSRQNENSSAVPIHDKNYSTHGNLDKSKDNTIQSSSTTSKEEIKEKLKAIKINYKYGEKGTSRFHLFSAEVTDAMEAKDTYKDVKGNFLTGDALKRKILENFKESILEITDIAELNSKIDAFKKTDEYQQVLDDSQGLTTAFLRFFGSKKPDSVNAFDKICDDARQAISSGNENKGSTP